MRMRGFSFPSSPQIFGQLVENTGIEGVLYPSKFTGEDCLVVYPQNFKTNDSFVELVDEPPESTHIIRVDKGVWAKHQGDLKAYIVGTY